MTEEIGNGDFEDKKITRRQFLKLVGASTGAAIMSNSLLGEVIASKETELKKIEDAYSEYSISWKARPWVWANLAIAREHIDGIQIKPGEEISLNDLLDFDEMEAASRVNTDPSEGYVAAQMSTKIDGWGYGLCLAATALYRAALESPLEITERGTHYDIYPSYFKDRPIGTDAAVYKPEVDDDLPETDLKLRNPTDKLITLKFGVFSADGEEIEVPDREISEIWYKATYLDHLVKILRRRLGKMTGVNMPEQYFPEHTFGNRNILVRAAFSGESIDYNVNISDVRKIVSSDPNTASQYTFDRKLVINEGAETKNISELHISQYRNT
ncbi:VanW family protein [Candidatus Woesebacteria bacterium]|nr:VanW family protein [Candidatus Woesebacteria bacterium]